MSDALKKETQRSVGLGLGGVTCPCCNEFFGKSRAGLNRLARSRLKQKDRKMIELTVKELSE